MNDQNKRILLEICVDNPDAAFAAIEGGADRLELNSALRLGGLTPSLGLIQQIRGASKIPLMIMIRPRPGGFAYSDREFLLMQRDCQIALEHGADGIVFGVLSPDGSLDVDRCQTMIQQIRPAQAVLHRAFDVVPDPLIVIQQAIDLGFDRILTSGQCFTVEEGIKNITSWIKSHGDKIEFLPGGGIRISNARMIIDQIGCNQIHASLRSFWRDSSLDQRPQLRFTSFSDSGEEFVDTVDAEAVKQFKEKILY